MHYVDSCPAQAQITIDPLCGKECVSLKATSLLSEFKIDYVASRNNESRNNENNTEKAPFLNWVCINLESDFYGLPLDAQTIN